MRWSGNPGAIEAVSPDEYVPFSSDCDDGTFSISSAERSVMELIMIAAERLMKTLVRCTLSIGQMAWNDAMQYSCVN